jgi:hypothetical protein
MINGCRSGSKSLIAPSSWPNITPVKMGSSVMKGKLCLGPTHLGRAASRRSSIPAPQSSIQGTSRWYNTLTSFIGRVCAPTFANIIVECETYQRHKYKTLTPVGLLQLLPFPEQFWFELSMDFIFALPTSFGYMVIMVVVDRLSKATHFVAIKHPYNATIVAQAIVEIVVKLHGMPKMVISNHDRVLISKFWQELFCLHGTKLRPSFGYHPQTNGQTKVVNAV